MTILAAILVAGVIQQQPAPTTQDPMSQLGAATAAMIVEWEDTRRPTGRYRFYQRRTSPGAEEVVWSVSLTAEGSDRDEFILTSDHCAALEPQMLRLETLNVGPVISPLSATAPSVRLGPALYTVWGRNRSAAGKVQSVMVRSQDGPVAEWGRDLLAVIESCQSQ